MRVSYQMSDGIFSKGGSSLKFAIGDSPTVGNLENGGTDHTNCRPEGIMAHLRPSWKFWVDFERFEPGELKILSLNLTTWHLAASGDKYISQSQNPQTAQADRMFLEQELEEI